MIKRLTLEDLYRLRFRARKRVNRIQAAINALRAERLAQRQALRHAQSHYEGEVLMGKLRAQPVVPLNIKFTCRDGKQRWFSLAGIEAELTTCPGCGQVVKMLTPRHKVAGIPVRRLKAHRDCDVRIGGA